MASNESFFTRLTRIFRSGPSIRRKIKGYDYNSYYDKRVTQNNLGYNGPLPFKREASQFSVMGAYGILNRMAQYAEYSEMEYTPIIAKALDIYADESFSGDENGQCFHISSDNPDIKKKLEELFYDTINIEFNGRTYVRNLCKYGDFFLYNEVAPDIGVINVQPIAVNELEREEGFDPEDPYAVRFKWLTRGQKYLENWQVTHMRILGNDLFLPYGTSLLESSRRIWRQYVMMVDAMLVYRLVRSPERRVFYIDVGTVAPNDVPNYMEAVKASLRSQTAVDKLTGRQDYRYNPVAVDEDYFIPMRGPNTATKIDTLAGGQHVTATEDIELIQSQLFAALGVPKAYLGYDESLSSKATLAQEDIRFSRSINIIQKIIIAELNKLAMLHLYACGWDGEDLNDFELRLSNPSTVALQQKLDIWSTKFDIVSTIMGLEERPVDMEWIQKEILQFNDDQISKIKFGLKEDKKFKAALELITEPDKDYEDVVDPFDPSSYELPGGNPPLPERDEGEGDKAKITPYDGEPKDDSVISNSIGDGLPIKASAEATRNRKNRLRRKSDGAIAANVPKLADMMNSRKNQSLRDVYDSEFLKNPFRESIEDEIRKGASTSSLSREMRSIIENFKQASSPIHPTLNIDLLREDEADRSEIVVPLKRGENSDELISEADLHELGVELKEPKT